MLIFYDIPNGHQVSRVEREEELIQRAMRKRSRKVLMVMVVVMVMVMMMVMVMVTIIEMMVMIERCV